MAEPTGGEAHLARSLYRVLIRRLESGRPFSWDDAGEHALSVVLRGSGKRSEKERAVLEKTLRALAATMPPPEPSVLEAFCEAAAAAARPTRPPVRHPGARLATEEPVPRRTHDLAEAAVYAEYARASSDDDLVRRAVTRALRERRRGRIGRRALDVEENDPLRRLLDLPDRGPALVPLGDVRGAMVKSFRGLLKQAAPFAEALLRPALGEELWVRCRPVGFADARRARILVEVPSSPVAHELMMMKGDIVRRLKSVPGLESVKDLRFVVREQTFLPLLR